jgi:hypothetical protein
MKQRLLSVVTVSLLLAGCSGSFSWGVGPTPEPTQTLSPTAISPQHFWDEELNPLLSGFQEWWQAAQDVSIGPDQEPLIRHMADALTALRDIEAGDVPSCARAGLSQVISGEETIVATQRDIAFGCAPGPVAGFCYFDQFDLDMQAGSAMFNSGIAQIMADCEVR